MWSPFRVIKGKMFSVSLELVLLMIVISYFFLLFSLMITVLFSWENAVKVIIIIPKQCVISIQLAWPQNKITVPRIICRSYIFMNVVYWSESLRLEHQSAQGQYYLTHTQNNCGLWEFDSAVWEWSCIFNTESNINSP